MPLADYSSFADTVRRSLQYVLYVSLQYVLYVSLQYVLYVSLQYVLSAKKEAPVRFQPGPSRLKISNAIYMI